MAHAAKIVHRNPLLDKLKEKQTGKEVEDRKVDIYDEEQKNLRFNISDYYLFSKKYYQLPLVYRTMLW